MKNVLRNYQKNYDVQRGSRPGQGQGLRVENFSDLKQRVLGNDNPVKLGKCIKELERIHGIQHGNNQHGERIGNGFQSSLTQEELAKELKKNKFQKCFCVYKAPRASNIKKHSRPIGERGCIQPREIFRKTWQRINT